MARMQLLQALAAAGRARSAAVAMGRRRCLLARLPAGAGLGPRAVRPWSLVPRFSTDAVEVEGEGEGAAVAGGKGVSARFKAADADADTDAAAQKTKPYAFDTFSTGSGNTVKAEGAGEVKAQPFGVRYTTEVVEEAGDIEEEKIGEGVGSKVAVAVADADVAAPKTKAYAFDALGTGNDNTAEAEDTDDVISIGEVKSEPFGVRNTARSEIIAGAGNTMKAVSKGKIDVKAMSFAVGTTAEDAEEEGPSDIKQAKVGSKTADGFCVYDEPRLKAYMDKFIAEKSEASAAYIPGLTENLEYERIKHRKERLHSDLRHLVLTVLGAVAVALAELYMQTLTGQKEGNKEEKDDKEVVNDEKKKVLPLV